MLLDGEADAEILVTTAISYSLHPSILDAFNADAANLEQDCATKDQELALERPQDDSNQNANPRTREQSRTPIQESPQINGSVDIDLNKQPVKHNLPTRPPRATFEEVSEQIKLHEYHTHQLQLLRRRQKSLQTFISLAARLRRTGFLIRDLLAEKISWDEKNAFSHIYTAALDLKDELFHHWNWQLQSLDHAAGAHDDSDIDRGPFLDSLSRQSRLDIVDMIRLLRSSPAFLVERFRGLTQAQILSFCAIEEVSEPPVFSSAFHDARQYRLDQKRIAKRLTSYANSLERDRPLSTILFNIYDNPRADSNEEELRVQVWSSVVAQLFDPFRSKFNPLVDEVIYAFASLDEWNAKPRMELYLLNLLQKGTSLIDTIPRMSRSSIAEFLVTPEANLFYEEAIQELFNVLDDSEAGLPSGALRFGAFVLGHMPPQMQSAFRGHLFYSWFFVYFLRLALAYPEVCISRAF